MNRDVAHQASQRLAGDWAAPDFTRALTREALAELLPRFERLEPLVRARLLLAAMHLPGPARAAMRAELQVPMPACGACQLAAVFCFSPAAHEVLQTLACHQP